VVCACSLGCFAQALVAALQPDTFFAQFGDPKTHQITLAQAKEYEQAMKDKLETMAKDGKLADTVTATEERGPRKGATSQMARLVCRARSLCVSLSHTSLFHAIGCPLSKTLSNCTSPSFSHLSPPQVRAVLSDFAVDEASLEVSSTRLFEFAIKCRDEALFPCLCFQLNSFKCLEMFKELLGQLESRQLLE
jgi:hypothetical protein